MIRVNLLAKGPGAAQPKVWVPAEQRASLIGLSLLLVTGLVVGSWWYYLNHQRAVTEEGIVTAEKRIEQLKDAMKLLEVSRTQKAELEERLSLIVRLRESKRAPVRIMQLVNTAVPDGLWLLEIKQTDKGVQIEGRAMSPSVVTDFARTLQESGIFKMPVEIVTTLMETVEETSVHRFVLKAEPVAASPTAPAVPGAAVTAPSGRPGI